MTIDPLTGLIQWTPTNADAGIQAVKIHVEDITGTFDEQYFELTVINEPADGDINLAGTVDISDVLLAQRIVNGDLAPTSQQFAHGDVAPLSGGVPSPDGAIDIADAWSSCARPVG